MSQIQAKEKYKWFTLPYKERFQGATVAKYIHPCKRQGIKHSSMNQEINGYTFSMSDLWRKAGIASVK